MVGTARRKLEASHARGRSSADDLRPLLVPLQHPPRELKYCFRSSARFFIGVLEARCSCIYLFFAPSSPLATALAQDFGMTIPDTFLVILAWLQVTCHYSDLLHILGSEQITLVSSTLHGWFIGIWAGECG